ncbi:MAG: copper chaperone PCu(A)C [Rubrivivax sp.]|nr:copper chaperone PCu(A)C [Rubrivivax sp.]
MNPLFQRRTVLHIGMALTASTLAPRARACEYFAPTLRVTHPWTRATAPGANHAVVCMKLDEVSQADRLIGVETLVAEGAELAGPGAGAAGPGLSLLIPAGSEIVMSEAGLHLRLLGLKHPLEVARSYPLLLRFEKGGVVDATLNVDYARFL